MLGHSPVCHQSSEGLYHIPVNEHEDPMLWPTRIVKHSRVYSPMMVNSRTGRPLLSLTCTKS